MQLALTTLPIGCIQPGHGYVRFKTEVTSPQSVSSHRRKENSKVLRSDLALSPIYLPYSPNVLLKTETYFLKSTFYSNNPHGTNIQTDTQNFPKTIPRAQMVSTSHNCTPILLQQAPIGKDVMQQECCTRADELLGWAGPL